MIIPVLLWANQWILIDLGMTGHIKFNPFKYLLFPCNKQPNGKYTKGLGDLAFIAYYIIFWSLCVESVYLLLTCFQRPSVCHPLHSASDGQAAKHPSCQGAPLHRA